MTVATTVAMAIFSPLSGLKLARIMNLNNLTESTAPLLARTISRLRFVSHELYES